MSRPPDPASSPAGLLERHPASFRDPNGYIASLDGQLVRVLTPQCKADYELLIGSGLYAALQGKRLLIEHQELPADTVPGAFKVLRPRVVPFISYPYEWCFGQLRDAALATLEIQKLALDHGMTLKDASAYNIQFIDGRPVLIDSLSFERLSPTPWIAYGQFCRHFLAPLALAAYADVRLIQLLRVHLDGVPLQIASRLLPFRSRFRPSLLLHLHAHAASERWLADDKPKRAGRSAAVSVRSLYGLVQTLAGAVRALRYEPSGKQWASYYTKTVTGGEYVPVKQQIVTDWISSLEPRSVWDLGANTGLFSRIAASSGASTVAFDADPECVEFMYRQFSAECPGVLPLFMDLANPSPAQGWAHAERMAWLQRPHPDLVLALALVHHLAIANNVPLPELAHFFHQFSPQLIIEFVPKDDDNAQKLLAVREDIFGGYTQANFESEFGRCFTIERSQPLPNSRRMLYLMRRKSS